VSLSGSLVLGLGVAVGALVAGGAWVLSRIVVAWQAGHWGLDSVADRTTAQRRRAFLQARDLLALLSGEAASRSAGNGTLN
jgi:chaperone required for assembly of F1-ATPase